VARIGRRLVEDGADGWGPLGGDRGRKRRRRAAQTRRRDGFWQIHQGHARGLREKRGAVGLAGLRGRMGQLAAGPIGPKVKEKILFRIKFDF
jgi:hypothetical protein